MFSLRELKIKMELERNDDEDLRMIEIIRIIWDKEDVDDDVRM